MAGGGEPTVLEQRAGKKERGGWKMPENKEESTGRILEGTLPRR